MTGQLNFLLDPKSVAIIGASEDRRKFGGRCFWNILDNGFKGDIYPVNPSRDTLGGLKCFASVGSIGEEVDVAMIAVPGKLLVSTLNDCAGSGVRAAVVINGIFAADADELQARQNELLEISKRSGMRIIGPNCVGYAAPNAGITVSSGTYFQNGGANYPGHVGLVSQSGALLGEMFVTGREAGGGFSACFSIGNQLDLDMADFIELLIEDHDTRVIALYVEGLLKPRRFVEALKKAREAGKPVVITKAGRTEDGAAQVQSHTASLAGSHAAFEAVCRSCGAIQFDQPEDMIRAADLLARSTYHPAGRVALISGSGGGMAIAADMLSDAGVPLATLTEETKSILSNYMPLPDCKLPFDLGTLNPGWTLDNIQTCLDAVAADDGVDCVLNLFTTQPFIAETSKAIALACAAAKKPLVVVASTQLVRTALIPSIKEFDLCVIPELATAVRILAAIQHQKPPSDSRPVAIDDITEFSGYSGSIGELDTKKLLEAAGIISTGDLFAKTVEGAVDAAKTLGFPVVLKGVAKSLIHKSDFGGVEINLKDENAVRKGFEKIQASLQSHGFADFVGCNVQRHVNGVAEIILGLKHDDWFGPMVLIGMGGIFVELIQDVRIAPAPISPQAAKEMLESLKLYPILTGERGRPNADIEAIAQAASRLSQIGAAFGDSLLELDINPLIVSTEGAVAVDGRATFKTEGTSK